MKTDGIFCCNWHNLKSETVGLLLNLDGLIPEEAYHIHQLKTVWMFMYICIKLGLLIRIKYNNICFGKVPSKISKIMCQQRLIFIKIQS